MRLRDLAAHAGLELDELAALGGANGPAGAGDHLEKEVAWSRDVDPLTLQLVAAQEITQSSAR